MVRLRQDVPGEGLTRTSSWSVQKGEGPVAYESVKIRDVVDRAVGHAWSIPEFQRGFVWKATQVRDLIESLWLDPIGSMLVWDSKPDDRAEERNVPDAKRPTWLVDGQQRAAALSILFRRKPYWWTDGEDWDQTIKKYDIRFDVDAKEPPYFWVANAAIRRARGDRYLQVARLLNLDVVKRDEDQATLRELAREIKAQDLCAGMDAMDVYSRLYELANIREHDVPVIVIDHDLEDVVEIFARLNSRGTRVTEADIYLGIVAARTPTWVREHFLPYRAQLANAGFDVSPNLLFRTLTAVGAGRVRFKEIPDTFWNAASIQPSWSRTQHGWKDTVSRLREFGVLSNDPMPTEAALVTLIALVERMPEARFEPMFYWFLQASRFGRYSGSGTTSLEEDLRDVGESTSLDDALDHLLRRFEHERPLEPDDFLRDYGDSRFGRFILYLLIYRNKSHDWDRAGHRLGFQGLEVLDDFRPQWHHVFPRKFLEGKVAAESIDSLANIAVIGPTINIRISAKDPLDYIDRYEISRSKLMEQYIDEDISSMTIQGYQQWLVSRAGRLADSANDYLTELRGPIRRGVVEGQEAAT